MNHEDLLEFKQHEEDENMINAIRKNSRQVKKIFSASTTSGTYSDKIILFILWIFVARREFLIQEYITEFGAMNHEDFL